MGRRSFGVHVTSVGQTARQNTNQVPCEPGHYCTGGADLKRACPVGQYQDRGSQSSCKVCEFDANSADPPRDIGRTSCDSSGAVIGAKSGKLKKELVVGIVGGTIIGVIVVALVALLVRGCKRKAGFVQLGNTVSSAAVVSSCVTSVLVCVHTEL